MVATSSRCVEEFSVLRVGRRPSVETSVLLLRSQYENRIESCQKFIEFPEILPHRQGGEVEVLALFFPTGGSPSAAFLYITAYPPPKLEHKSRWTRNTVNLEVPLGTQSGENRTIRCPGVAEQERLCRRKRPRLRQRSRPQSRDRNDH